MNHEEKQALIEDCKTSIARIEKALPHWQSSIYTRPYLESELARQQIALASLLAEPVGNFYEDGKDSWWQLGPHDKVPHVTPLYANPPAPAMPNGFDPASGHETTVVTHYHAHGEWIKCSEQMPEPFDWVIAYDEVGTVKAYICKNSNEWVRDNGDNLYAVTHWMPLPAAPEVSE